METISTATTAIPPARLRRRRSRLASLVATGAGALVATIGLGYPAVAAADPNNGGGPGGGGEWDIGAYDFCMAHPAPGTTGTTEEVLDQHRWCCESTGGVWGSGNNGCHAPPGEASAPLGPGPPKVAPPAGVSAPPPPVNPTAPVNPGRSR